MQALTYDNPALMIIDMQNDGLDMIPTGKNIITPINTILECCRHKHVPIIFKLRVQRKDGIDVEKFRIELFKKKPFLVDGTTGANVVKELQPKCDEYIVKGTRFSGFFQTDLQLILTRLGIKTLIICGMQTPNCIRATVTDALAYDYQVVLVRDAVAAQTEQVHEANLFDMMNMGVEIVYVNEVVSKLR